MSLQQSCPPLQEGSSASGKVGAELVLNYFLCKMETACSCKNKLNALFVPRPCVRLCADASGEGRKRLSPRPPLPCLLHGNRWKCARLPPLPVPGMLVECTGAPSARPPRPSSLFRGARRPSAGDSQGGPREGSLTRGVWQPPRLHREPAERQGQGGAHTHRHCSRGGTSLCTTKRPPALACAPLDEAHPPPPPGAHIQPSTAPPQILCSALGRLREGGGGAVELNFSRPRGSAVQRFPGLCHTHLLRRQDAAVSGISSLLQLFPVCNWFCRTWRGRGREGCGEPLLGDGVACASWRESAFLLPSCTRRSEGAGWGSGYPICEGEEDPIRGDRPGWV